MTLLISLSYCEYVSSSAITYIPFYDITSVSLNELKAIPKMEVEKCFKDWQKRWHKCIVSNGDYFEGNNINVDE
jgi:hypothetical protein